MVNKGKAAMQINVLPSPLIRVSRDLESSFSSWFREGDTLTNGVRCVEISPINVM